MAFSLLTTRVSLCAGSFALLGCLAGCGGGDGGTGGHVVQVPYPTIEDTAFPAPEKTWSHGEPTALEQQLLELIQRARRNPGAEVDLLLATPGVATAMQQFKVNEQKLRDDFATYKAVPPLSFDEKLMASSKFHSEDMSANAFQEHDGSAGEHFDQRITTAGYKWSFASENIFAFAESMPYCHAAFMVDWGNPDPGHRKAILDIDGKKRDIGISVIDHQKKSASDVGPHVVTQDFAAPLGSPADAQVYIVGVAYVDDNGNEAYDAGEGVKDLKVIPEKGTYMAVTGESGGFSVPMAGKAGTVMVQLQIEVEGKPYVVGKHEVTLDGSNVELDFVLTPK